MPEVGPDLSKVITTIPSEDSTETFLTSDWRQQQQAKNTEKQFKSVPIGPHEDLLIPKEIAKIKPVEGYPGISADIRASYVDEERPLQLLQVIEQLQESAENAGYKGEDIRRFVDLNLTTMAQQDMIAMIMKAGTTATNNVLPTNTEPQALPPSPQINNLDK